jgi:hypothetical protein
MLAVAAVVVNMALMKMHPDLVDMVVELKVQDSLQMVLQVVLFMATLEEVPIKCLMPATAQGHLANPAQQLSPLVVKQLLHTPHCRSELSREMLLEQMFLLMALMFLHYLLHNQAVVIRL